MYKDSFTFSIPAYNEGPNILALVDECIKTANELQLNFEILIIDDGSTDETPKHIEALKKKYNFIKSHKHQQNMGFGATIGEVFLLPTTDWLLFISGDNQFPASNLHSMIKYTDKYDFILGYRAKRNDNIYRRINSRLYNLCISLIAGRKVIDVNSMVLVKTSYVNDLELNAKSGFIHAEVFLKAMKKNIRFIEIPITHSNRTYGEASGGRWKTIVNAFKETVKYTIGKL